MVEKEFEFWTSLEFSPLRHWVVSRLTLFNARRGGEPSRLLLKGWEAADKDVWLPQQTIEQIDDPAERLLAGSLKIAYQSGKGSKHLVSLLIPTDCVKAMRILVESEVHRNAGVNVNNSFVFPYTQSSINRVSVGTPHMLYAQLLVSNQSPPPTCDTGCLHIMPVLRCRKLTGDTFTLTWGIQRK